MLYLGCLNIRCKICPFRTKDNVFNLTEADQKPLIFYHVSPFHFYCFFLSAAYVDTGWSSSPDVIWNGDTVSDGDTLPYCPTRERCVVQFFATSDHSPSVAVNSSCYTVAELDAKFSGSVMDVTQHPKYTFSFHCTNISRFRLVYSLSEYSKEYTLERSNGEFCVAYDKCPTLACTSTVTHQCIHMYTL